MRRLTLIVLAGALMLAACATDGAYGGVGAGLTSAAPSRFARG